MSIQATLLETHTSIPAEVQSYSPATQTVQVRIAIDPVIEGETTPYPLLDDIPVCFPRSKGFGITFPLAKGDGVLLVFGERNTDRWRSTGAGSPPSDARRFDINDAVAIPGYFPIKDVMVPPPSEATEIRGSKIFVGDPLQLTTPIITTGALPGLPAGVAVMAPPAQLDLTAIISNLIDLVAGALYGIIPAGPTGGGGGIDPESSAALTSLKSDLAKLQP